MSKSVKLDPRLDLSAASALLTSLKDRKDEDLELDFSDVKHLGALCMQVIIAAATTAKTQGRKMSITKVSDRVIDQMRVMGMTPETIAAGRQ